MFTYISQLTCLEYYVTCAHPPQGAFVYFTVQYCIEYCCTVSSFQAQNGPRRHWIILSKRWIELNPAGNQSLCHQHQAWVKSQPVLRLLLGRSFSSTISQLLSLLHQWLVLTVHLMPAPGCQLLHCTTVFFKVLYSKIKDVFCIFVCLLCIICMKSINLLHYSTI